MEQLVGPVKRKLYDTTREKIHRKVTNINVFHEINKDKVQTRTVYLKKTRNKWPELWNDWSDC